MEKNIQTQNLSSNSISYDEIMQKIAESKGLTIQEMTKQNFKFVQESLFSGQGYGLNDEAIEFIKERLEKEKNTD